MKLMPVERMALDILGWAALAALSFFFHIVGFLALMVILCLKVLEFKFVYENTRDIEPSGSTNTPEEESYVSDGHSDDPTTTDLYINEPFPELGTEWRERLSENISESETRWDKRVVG